MNSEYDGVTSDEEQLCDTMPPICIDNGFTGV